MIHFVIIVFFLALIVGTAAIVRITLIRRRSRLPFLTFLFYGILLLNLGALTAIVSYYLKANIVSGKAGGPPLTEIYFKWNDVLSTGLLGGLNISFLLMISALLQRRLPSLFRGVFIAGWAAGLSFQAAANILPGLSNLEFIMNWMANHMLTTTVFLIGGGYFLLRVREIKPQYRRQRLFGFARIQLTWILTWVLLRSLYYVQLIAEWTFVFFEAVLFLTTNVLVLLFLRGFTSGIQNGSRMRIFSVANRKEKFIKFGITKREQEIIHLICAGKSNREIEDQLFISLQSVKDHIYRIYQKTGVKNRVQLANLFTVDKTGQD
ncbi:MAG: helix-turn-helix transcriptional regulator [Candidatus Aminicenantes bacterium]|nr:helix-turn-helix transcriptional regulator [Candidatus Aminicenantes bacterium]